jgi:hypothetical protein
MKLIKPILLLSFLFSNSSVFAQNNRKFDTAFSSISYANYFQKNSSIKKIEFYTYKDKSKYLEVFPKTIWQAMGANYTNLKMYESYNFGFPGDIYLLEKKYGRIDLPEKEIVALIKKTCGEFYTIRGYITTDSIRLELSYTCTTDPEEKYFEKVEIGVRYTGSVNRLKQQLEDAIKIKNIVLTDNIEDSVLIFNTILDNKDSSLKRIELIEGKYSVFSQTMLETLIKSGPWLPPLQGGRPVRAYFKIFIRLQKDKAITVAISN